MALKVVDLSFTPVFSAEWEPLARVDVPAGASVHLSGVIVARSEDGADTKCWELSTAYRRVDGAVIEQVGEFRLDDDPRQTNGAAGWDVRIVDLPDDDGSGCPKLEIQGKGETGRTVRFGLDVRCRVTKCEAPPPEAAGNRYAESPSGVDSGAGAPKRKSGKGKRTRGS